jgi:hypothetical protein
MIIASDDARFDPTKIEVLHTMFEPHNGADFQNVAAVNWI